MATNDPGLRQRKKQRTRRALADAALRLFAERGYEHTTVADIAAAADVSTRTFFSYFPTRADVLFADTDERLEVLRTTLADLPQHTSPVAAAHQIVDQVFATPGAVFSPGRDVRNELVLTRPELRAKALERLAAAQAAFADWLHTRDRDEVTAATISGALLGGLVGAAMASLRRKDTPDDIRAHLHRAVTLLETGIDAGAQDS